MDNNTAIVDTPITRTIAMLTTYDNPYDYFTQYEQWLAYDNEFGYNCCGYLDRIITKNGGIPDDATIVEEIDIQTQAIDEIVAINPRGVYVKTTKDIICY